MLKIFPCVHYLFSRFTWLENRVSQKRLQILGLTASNLQTFFSTPCFPASWTWKTSNSHMEKFSALQIWKIIGTKYYFLKLASSIGSKDCLLLFITMETLCKMCLIENKDHIQKDFFLHEPCFLTLNQSFKKSAL